MGRFFCCLIFYLCLHLFAVAVKAFEYMKLFASTTFHRLYVTNAVIYVFIFCLLGVVIWIFGKYSLRFLSELLCWIFWMMLFFASVILAVAFMEFCHYATWITYMNDRIWNSAMVYPAAIFFRFISWDIISHLIYFCKYLVPHSQLYDLFSLLPHFFFCFNYGSLYFDS